jgi:seryl-tRNA synthetase
LVGTSEITTAGMYSNQVLKVSELPLKYVAFSHCFRVEVGKRGVDVKGLYRVV